VWRGGGFAVLDMSTAVVAFAVLDTGARA